MKIVVVTGSQAQLLVAELYWRLLPGGSREKESEIGNPLIILITSFTLYSDCHYISTPTPRTLVLYPLYSIYTLYTTVPLSCYTTLLVLDFSPSLV